MGKKPESFRHTPKQVRGIRTVQHILETAEKLFTERGFENVTTNEIAQQANVAIGSLYQFFASKEAILEAVAARYLGQTDEALEQAYEDTRDMDLQSAIQTILKLAIKLQSRRPIFLRYLAVTRPQALTEIMATLDRAMVARTMTILKRYGGDLDSKFLGVRAQILVSATGAMLPHAVQAKGKMRQLIVDEITIMAVQYITYHRDKKSDE